MSSENGSAPALDPRLAELLKNPEVFAALSQLAGVGVSPKTPPAKKQKSLHKLLPDHVLVVKTFCQLCGTDSVEAFRMVYNAENGLWTSKRLSERTTKGERALNAYELRAKEKKALFRSETGVEILELKRQNVLALSCGECELVLNAMPQPDLVRLVLRKVAHIDEVAEATKVCVRVATDLGGTE